MNEPTRWRDGGERLDPDIAHLLRSASGSRPMTNGQYARTWRRLQPLVAVAPAAGVLLWVKASLAALAVVVVGTATVYAVRRLDLRTESAPPRLSQSVPAPPQEGPDLPSVTAESDAAASSAVAPQPPQVADPETKPLSNKATVHHPVPAGSSDALVQELALIERARALVRSDPAEAQRLLRDHATRFPRGTLAMEREMVMIEALMYSGHRAEARSKAESMLRQAKGSLYETRLSNLLQQMQ